MGIHFKFFDAAGAEVPQGADNIWRMKANAPCRVQADFLYDNRATFEGTVTYWDGSEEVNTIPQWTHAWPEVLAGSRRIYVNVVMGDGKPVQAEGQADFK